MKSAPVLMFRYIFSHSPESGHAPSGPRGSIRIRMSRNRIEHPQYQEQAQIDGTIQRYRMFARLIVHRSSGRPPRCGSRVLPHGRRKPERLERDPARHHGRGKISNFSRISTSDNCVSKAELRQRSPERFVHRVSPHERDSTIFGNDERRSRCESATKLDRRTVPSPTQLSRRLELIYPVFR